MDYVEILDMIRDADVAVFPRSADLHETVLNAATQIYIEQMRIKAQNADRQQHLIIRLKSALQRYTADMVDNSFSNEEAEAIIDAATYINKFLDDWSVDNE